MAKHHIFGSASRSRLNTCHPDLIRVAERALELTPYDFTIIWGHRNKADQDAAVAAGNSSTPWPTSKHNRVPSHALDFAPWIDGKIPWADSHIFAVVAGCFMAAALELEVRLRWGGDWDCDGSTRDQKLMDWGHVEIAP